LILGVIEFEVAVNTTGGQIVDQQLMVGAATSGELRAFSTEFIGLVTPILLVGGVLMVLMITLRNNPIALALRVAVVTLGPITTAWVLKQSLDRPNLNGLVMHNSFPSGTLTAIAALVCAIVLATPARWRVLVAVNGALITIGTAISVVVLQWHRPSDVLGALLLVGCYTLAVSAFPLNTTAARHAVLANSGNERLSSV
jgi:membrane-associated phospholipid phosphatase